MEPRKIQASWHQLLADQKDQKKKPTELPSIETKTSTSGGNIRLAISDGGFCTVLLPVAVTESVESDLISQLISVRPVTLGLKGKPVRFIEVRCEDERLNEVFARVVSDILRRIETGATGLRAVNEALIEFRRLLHIQRVSSQDEKTIVGLIGELLTLIEVLNIEPNALSAWHGPNSDRHDFRAGTVTIEVKTSLGADGNKIHINGMRQLEIGNDDRLLIRHIRIEPDPDGNLSVPALVSEIGALLADRTEFEEKLEKLGYTADVSEVWQSKRYRRVGGTSYDVQGEFPRLIPALLNVDWPIAGVSAVSYEVDLGAAANCKVEDADWQARLKEFCACL